MFSGGAGADTWNVLVIHFKGEKFVMDMLKACALMLIKRFFKNDYNTSYI